MPSWPIRFHNWLRALPDAQLWVALFICRACILMPPLAIFYFGKLEVAATPQDFVSRFHSPVFLVYVLLAAPVLETLFECSLPHLILKTRVKRQPWLFAILSAVLMVAIHPFGPASVFPLLTGLLIAYCYLLFLQRYSARITFAVTASLHIAINLAGLAISLALLPRLVAVAA